MDPEILEKLRQYRTEMENTMDTNQQKLDSGKYEVGSPDYHEKAGRAAVLSYFIEKLDELFPELAEIDSK